MGANVWPVNAVTGSPTYQGRALRQTTVAPFLAGQTAARPAGAFSGVRPNTATTIATATSTTWTVTPFGGVIDGEALNVAGPYSYFFDTNQTGSLTAAAGSARIDRLDVQVSDPAESDGSSTPAIAIIKTDGIAGSGVPNTAPARSHPLALINVPASGGGSPTVTWNATYAASSGGILPATSSATYPTASATPGQYLDDLTTGTLKRSNGSAWVAVGSGVMFPSSVTGGTTGLTGEVTSGSVALTRLNGVFVASQYRRYEIAFDITCASSTTLAGAFSVAGTDTATGYDNQRLTSVNATATAAQSLNTTAIICSGGLSSTRHVGKITVWSPNNAVETYWRIETIVSPNPMTASFGQYFGGGLQRATTQFDGISFVAGTGNITVNSLSVTGVV